MRFAPLVLTILAYSARGQIVFDNPSLEGTPGNELLPPFWTACDWTPDTQPFTSIFVPAFDSNSYVALGALDGVAVYERIGAPLSCVTVSGAEHAVTFAATGFATYAPGYATGVVELWGGTSLCERHQLLATTPPLDTAWQTYTLHFTPSDTFRFLTFGAGTTNAQPTYVGLDAVSTVTLVSGVDTVIRTNGCVTLQAPLTENASAFSWQSIPSGFTDSTATPGQVCDDSATVYLLTITFYCGLQRIDTFYVEEITALSVSQRRPSVSVSPVPTAGRLLLKSASIIQSVTIYNLVGREVLRLQTSTDHVVSEIDVSNLVPGVYFLSLELQRGDPAVLRFIKTEK